MLYKLIEWYTYREIGIYLYCDMWICFCSIFTTMHCFPNRYENLGMKLDNAIKGCSEEQRTILIGHQPKAAKIALQSNNKIDLILCGK